MTCPRGNVLALDAAEEEAHVVAGLAVVERLAEHLDAGDDRLSRLAEADDLDLLAGLDDAALDTAGRDGAAPLDAEDVLDGHQERLVARPLRLRDVRVDRVHQLPDALELGRVGVLALRLHCLEGGAPDDRHLVAGEVVLVRSSRSSSSTRSSSSGSSIWSILLRKTTIAGTSTWWARRTCSRVCGIGPSGAATTRIAPSICAAPVIMFLI